MQNYLQFHDSEEISHLFESLQKGPLNNESSIKLENLLKRNLPPWHMPMLNDEHRNQFYEKMIKRHAKDKVILEIGTGVGLLAIMAAKAGAKHVYTCEMNPVLWMLAERNISKSKYKDRITLLFSHSADLKLKEHIPTKVDIILSEIISDAIISEGMLSTLKDAKRLLKKDGIFLPQEIQVYGTLINLKKDPSWVRSKLDPITQELEILNKFKRQHLILDKKNHRPLSSPTILFSVKDGFQVTPSLPVEFSIKTSKRSHKEQYFCLHFSMNDGKHSYDSYNYLDSKNTRHWMQPVWYLGTEGNYHLALVNEDEDLYLIRKNIND